MRASRRRREAAIRAALGATRGRLVSQALIEAAVVSLAATAVSLLLASWFEAAVRQVLLPDIAPADGAARATMLAAVCAGLLAAIATSVANASNLPRAISAGSLDGFSALALIVGAVGLYAAFSHAVTMRRREMAIRMAIGSRLAGVIALVLREALTLAAAGVVVGWIAIGIGGRWLQSMLYDTSRTDPLVLGGAAALMLAVALVATLLPARAASRANPASLLRS